MVSMIRRFPPLCIVFTLFALLVGRLRLNRVRDQWPPVPPVGIGFEPFRTIQRRRPAAWNPDGAFCVTFRFTHLSDTANRAASIIPMLAIPGQPGFISKTYAVNPRTGQWKGIYRWETKEHRDRYRESTVYRAMKRRAVPGTIHENLGTRTPHAATA